jgi:hypothetical protein
MNANPHKTMFLAVNAWVNSSRVNTGKRNRMPALGILCVLVALAASSSAQQSKFNTRIHHSSVANEKLPRSLSSSAAAAASTRPTASRMELDRLEHANLGPRAGVVHHTASRSAMRGAVPARTRNHSAPINFAYQGPRNGAVGHHNAASQAR